MGTVEYIAEDTPWPCGWKSSGWYHWDETWTICYGPYPTEREAREACVRYVEVLMDLHVVKYGL